MGSPTHKELVEMVSRDIASRRHRFGFSWDRFAKWILSVVIFSTISFIAITISLGYKVDLAHGTLDQTSLIELNGPLSNSSITVTLNGNTVVHSQFPAKISGINPGYYSVVVTRDGYRPWSQNVYVLPNQRVMLNDVFLVYSKTTPHPISNIAMDDSRFSNQDTHTLQIKNQNELWVNDVFVTRTTKNLYNAQWLPGYNLITVQSGSEILLIDPDPTSVTQEQSFVTLPSSDLVSYFFTNGDRSLIYRAQTSVQQMDIFEDTGFFGFLN